ncbi:polysaccharide deacetylase family protein [Aliikangiella sp. IMCC44359]|uniref:polysaccharide deacetylase family protein n=1 Tax=Aliikangiella sp. IMCC44359 TaxID=3459125 RepID=UPI00403B2979
MIKNFLKEVVSRTLDYSGVLDKKINTSLNQNNNWLVLMYHRIITDNKAEDPYQLGMCVNGKNFNQQIKYLKKKFEILTVSEVVHCLKNKKPLPKNVVSITFDDGYKDNLTNAAPILKNHGIHASLYVATDIFKERVFWWDRTIQIFSEARSSEFSIELKDGPQNFKANRSGLESLLLKLWLETEDSKERIIQKLLDENPITTDLTHLYLNKSELKQITEQHFEIGAHTCSHPNLELLKDDEIMLELSESKAYLEKILEENVDGFAYPGGYIRDDSVNLLERAGFKYALTTVSGINRFEQNEFLIKRMGMPNSSISDFKRCLSNILVTTS